MNSEESLGDGFTTCEICGVTFSLDNPSTGCESCIEWRIENEPRERYCAGCGEREGSSYAKHCCTDDNMIED